MMIKSNSDISINSLSEKYDDAVRQTIVFLKKDSKIQLDKITLHFSKLKSLFIGTINYYSQNGKASMEDESFDIFTEDYFDRLIEMLIQLNKEYKNSPEQEYFNRFANLILNIFFDLSIQEKDKYTEQACKQAIEELNDRKDQFTCSF